MGAHESHSITFTVNGIPKGQGNHRRNRAGATYEATKGHAAWRRAIINAAEEERQRVGTGTFTVPVLVGAYLQFARPASHYGTGRNSKTLRANAPAMPTTRRVGDIDKHARSLLDALTASHVIDDDSLVVALDVAKRWCLTGETPGCSITVREAWI